MSLEAGTRLGSYEIVSLLGAGGMGEVYRARDSRLNRQVAIKILPRDVAASPDRLERFSSEARAASALNHPHIVTVHELGTHDGTPFIVSELLEGSELGAMINGRPMPPRTTLDYASQILDGLGAAHDRGIVHRDLKPANIFVTNNGRVKILDFGLARIEETAADGATRPATGSGMVLGTAGYMSPEQVRGERADRRSDLFSFGVILYEMLTGRPAFERSTGVEAMAAVLNDEPPDLSDSGVTVPLALERVVRRCLEKSADRRFQSAADLAFALGNVTTLSDARAATQVAGQRRSPMLIVAGAAMLLILVAAIAMSSRSWFGPRQAIVRPPLELSLSMPADTAPSWIAISPDGHWLAFAAATGSKTQLWVRSMSAATAQPLAGTDNAALPFWSPDSRFIGYFAAGKLRKIEPGGGASTAIADSGVATGGTWSRDGVILFASLGTGLSKVSANGGAVEPVLAPDVKRQETDYSNPLFLPDGRRFFFTAFGGQPEGRGTFVASLDGGERRRITDESSNVAVADVAGAGTFLIFAREATLMAQRFDASTLQLSGEAVTLAPIVGSGFDSAGSGVNRRTFTASSGGVIVLDPVITRLDSHAVMTDRHGRNSHFMEDMNLVDMVRLSRDGKRLAVARRQGGRGDADIWIGSPDGPRADRFTFDPARDIFPVWSPDGSQIAWASNRDGDYHIYRKASTGSGSDELLLESPGFKLPTDWSPDGRFIVYRVIDPVTHYDLWALPMAPGAKPFPVLKTPANEAAAVVSPNGRWMGYSSDETGRYEVYVQAFPDGGGKRQISTLGGNGPMWRGDGRELFFHAPNGDLMAVNVDPATGTIDGAASTLFSFAPGGILITPYFSPTPDGQRFLLSQLVQHGDRTPLTVLVDWAARLTK